MRITTAAIFIGAVLPVALGGSAHSYCERTNVCATKQITDRAQCRQVCNNIDKECASRFPSEDEKSLGKRTRCVRHNLGQWARHNKKDLKN